jgi:FkbM family methyltransferase
VNQDVRYAVKKYVFALARYVYALGPVRGSSVFVRAHAPGRYRSILLAGYRAPIWLRPGTSDTLLVEQVLIRRELELYEYLRPEPPGVIIDGGANAGYTSIYFANRYPEARILAIEPEPTNFAMLVRNTSAYPNVEPVRAALWPRKTALTIMNPTNDPWTFQMKESEKDESGDFPVLTMQDVVDWADARIGLLKLDIEGGERELFGDENLAWLDQVDALVIESHDWIDSGCSQALYSALSVWNFDQHIEGEHLFILRIHPEDAHERRARPRATEPLMGAGAGGH